jgi:hypothetical protein
MIIGPIIRRHAWWQRALPIRTIEHALWAAGITAIVFCASGYFTQWRFESQIAITGCAFIGTLPGFASNLPAFMRIDWSLTEFDPDPVVNDALERAGWIKIGVDGAEAHYVQKIPRFLRWQTGTIVAMKSPRSVEISGPIFGLHLCRRILSKTRDA